MMKDYFHQNRIIIIVCFFLLLVLTIVYFIPYPNQDVSSEYALPKTEKFKESSRLKAISKINSNSKFNIKPSRLTSAKKNISYMAYSNLSSFNPEEFKFEINRLGCDCFSNRESLVYLIGNWALQKPESFKSWARNLNNEQLFDIVSDNLCSSWDIGEISQVKTYLEEVPNQQWQAHLTLSFIKNYAAFDPIAAQEWFQQLQEPKRRCHAAKTIAAAMVPYPEAAKTWINELPEELKNPALKAYQEAGLLTNKMHLQQH